MTDCLFLGSKCQGSNANKSCCTSSSPCKEDEGDCDIDSHCEGGLVCGTDNCPSGFPDSSYDCCEKPSGLLYTYENWDLFHNFLATNSVLRHLVPLARLIAIFICFKKQTT